MSCRKLGSGYAAEIDAVVAGFHSVLSISLDALSLAENPTVTFHEVLHERILMRTPDGLTHLRLKQLSVECAADEGTRNWAAQWCEAIEQESAIAHESIATYCGIKQAACKEHPAAIAALSADYLSWFQSLAEPIDKVFYASYVQYLIGWFLAELCFSTSMPARICLNRPGSAIVFADDEKPNWRLERILDRFSEEEMKDLLRCLQAVTTVDIQSEDAWEALPIQDQKSLDGQLSKTIREWAEERDFGLDTTVAYGDWGALTSKVVTHLDSLEGGEMPSPLDPSRSGGQPPITDDLHKSSNETARTS
ncbi:hypothetical protein [Rhizobium laguerreae]|uniref:hypothetical protein n=1 Tax=Rhizobium laguerreae TaxID=1076926 RepID=UPI001C90D46A|nr:hypothetical protein [Rhizobium laguerreae]MBY3381692.1 hypothetical protein [Rhizobium laguerreae]